MRMVMLWRGGGEQTGAVQGWRSTDRVITPCSTANALGTNTTTGKNTKMHPDKNLSRVQLPGIRKLILATPRVHLSNMILAGEGIFLTPKNGDDRSAGLEVGCKLRQARCRPHYKDLELVVVAGVPSSVCDSCVLRQRPQERWLMREGLSSCNVHSARWHLGATRQDLSLRVKKILDSMKKKVWNTQQLGASVQTLCSYVKISAPPKSDYVICAQPP